MQDMNQCQKFRILIRIVYPTFMCSSILDWPIWGEKSFLKCLKRKEHTFIRTCTNYGTSSENIYIMYKLSTHIYIKITCKRTMSNVPCSNPTNKFMTIQNWTKWICYERMHMYQDLFAISILMPEHQVNLKMSKTVLPYH